MLSKALTAEQAPLQVPVLYWVYSQWIWCWPPSPLLTLLPLAAFESFLPLTTISHWRLWKCLVGTYFSLISSQGCLNQKRLWAISYHCWTIVQLVLHPLTDLSEDLRGKLWQWKKLHMRMWGRGCPSQCLQEVTTTSHRLAKGSQGINLGLNRVNVLHYKICVNTVNGTECVSSIYISYCTVCCSISIWIKKASNSTHLRQKARCRESVFKQDKRVLMKTKSPEWVCYKEKLCLWKGFYVSLKPGVAAFIPAPQPVWYWYVWVVFESLALSSDR